MSISEVTGRISPKATFSRSSSIFTYPIARIIHRYQGYESLPSEFTVLALYHFSLSCIGEGNGNPLQYSCLENPRDGGAWWAAVSGVAESDTTEAT